MRNRNVLIDPYNVDYSLRRYIYDSDTELERTYHLFKDKRLYHSFDDGIRTYARAAIFDYASRHPADDEVVKFVNDFRETYAIKLNELGIRPEESDKIWGNPDGKYFAFADNEWNSILLWATFDPHIIFSDVKIDLPFTKMIAKIVRRTKENFEFIFWVRDFCGKDVYVRHKRDVDYYIAFLKEVNEISKDWDTKYDIFIASGDNRQIHCADLNVDVPFRMECVKNYKKYDKISNQFFETK